MPRLTNTIQLHALCKSEEERSLINEQLKQLLKQPRDVELEVVADDKRVHESYDPIYSLTARLYTQPEQKAFIKYLRETLPEEHKKRLRTEAAKHLDERENFFFRLDKQAFINGECLHVLRGDVIQVRVNLCAHPKTRENVLECIFELLA